MQLHPIFRGESMQLSIGKIVNTHGIRGELKVMPNTDSLEERFAKGNEVFIHYGKDTIYFEIDSFRIHKGCVLVTFKDHHHINDVEKYKVERSLADIKWTGFLMAGDRNPPERTFLGITITPPKGQHFSLVQPKVDKLLSEFHLRLRCKKCGSLYYEANSTQELEQKMKGKTDKFKFYDITKKDGKINPDLKPAPTETLDVATLSFTSGSTGTPKVVPLTHFNLIECSNSLEDMRVS